MDASSTVPTWDLVISASDRVVTSNLIQALAPAVLDKAVMPATLAVMLVSPAVIPASVMLVLSARATLAVASAWVKAWAKASTSAEVVKAWATA